jgi:DNA (cytosine-5)-methyltransferase 1
MAASISLQKAKPLRTLVSIWMTMNELALFAGAGGGILGGKLLGWRTVCAVERDAYAAQVLAQRQNDGLLEVFPIWSDVCSFDGKPWRGIVDVISGGFPCQDISAAGKGAGIEGERSGMWKEFARIIGDVMPRYVFVENSPMLTTRGLGTVLRDLAALGFDAEWAVLSAADVGAPHLRERIWIVGKQRNLGYTYNNGQIASEISRSPTQRINSDPQRPSKTCQPTRSSKQYGQLESDGRYTKRQLADTYMLRCNDGQVEIKPAISKLNAQCQPCASSANVANASQQPLRREPNGGIYTKAFSGKGQNTRQFNGSSCKNNMGNTESIYAQGQYDRPRHIEFGRASWWAVEPALGRVANGVADRVDRLKAIGNGQVPLCAATAFELLRARIE